MSALEVTFLFFLMYVLHSTCRVRRKNPPSRHLAHPPSPPVVAVAAVYVVPPLRVLLWERASDQARKEGRQDK